MGPAPPAALGAGAAVIRRLFAAVAAVMVISAGARADAFKTGNVLYQECAAPIGTREYANCQHYVMGVADVMAGNNTINGYAACFPRDVTVGQIRDVVTRYLANLPQSRNKGAAGLAADALAQAFPCRR
jgi:hypothetical protein